MPAKEFREPGKDGLISRKVYPQVPPKGEYSLAETAIS
ncbi:MAG: winged helix-turn-helix transcriptional regulator [Methanoregula sp.]